MKENAVEKIRNFIEDVMKDRKLLAKILSIIVILALAAVIRISDANKADISVEAAETAETEQYAEETVTEYDPASSMYVDISGAVKSPGVYQVTDGTRLYEVVDMAGGLTEEADTDSVNQAAFVEDGQKILIPFRNRGEAGAGADASASSGITAEGLVNINTASKEELKTLHGIGDVTAEKIIEYRSQTRFRKKEDIMSVKGIGSGTYDKIKDRITC